MSYHPINDIPEATNWINTNRPSYWNDCKKSPNLSNRRKNSNKQILAHSFLMSKIEKKYDIIIRARWDVLVSKNFKFDRLFEDVIAGHTYGFFINRNNNDYNQVTHIDKDHSMYNMYSKKNLCDYLILHEQHKFNIDYVNTLHYKKKLYPAEFGWYQILSEPYNDQHISMLGGIKLYR